jgi:hypothetical protein
MESQFELLPFSMSIASVWMLGPDYIGIRSKLEERGYTVKGPEVERRPDLLATKGTVEVYVGSERRMIGIRGTTSTRDLADAYSDLMNICFDMLGIDSANILFHEFLGDLTVSTRADPMNVLTKINQNLRLVDKIGSVLGIKSSAMGLQVILKDSSPTSSKWLSIRFEPFFVSFNKRYRIQAVYRDSLESVIEFVKNFEARLKQIIEKLETEAGVR